MSKFFGNIFEFENNLLISSKKSIYINKIENNNKLLDNISLAKIIACFSVVILHTNGAFWKFNYNNYKTYWISANYIECIFYFAVPFFVLCIGATLLDFNEKYGLKIYFKRRIIKVVIIMLEYNIIFL